MIFPFSMPNLKKKKYCHCASSIYVSFLLLLIAVMLQKSYKQCSLSCWTKRLSIINFCLSQSLFSAVIQNPTEKIPLAFCQGNQGAVNSQAGLQIIVIPAALYLKSTQRYTMMQQQGKEMQVVSKPGQQWPFVYFSTQT